MKNTIEIASTDKETALAEIMSIRDRIAAMGANDSEFNRIDEVVARLNGGECSPDEAVKVVREIESCKQDYH